MNKTVIVLSAFLFVSVISLVGPNAQGDQTTSASIAEIKELFNSAVSRIREKRSQITILYSEAGKDGYDIKSWRLEHDGSQYKRGVHEAHIFKYKNRIIKARIATQSLSGDWAYVTEYFYYPNGDLAFIFEGNVTYNGYVVKNGKKKSPNGPFVVEKRSYFSKQGIRIRYLRKAYIKRTKEKVPLDQIQNIDLEKYGSASSLPFFELIRNK